MDVCSDLSDFDDGLLNSSPEPVLVNSDEIETLESITDEHLADVPDWHQELEDVLNGDFADQGIIKSICKCRLLPPHLRYIFVILIIVALLKNQLLEYF